MLCVNAHILKCMLRFPQSILPCLRIPDLLLINSGARNPYTAGDVQGCTNVARGMDAGSDRHFLKMLMYYSYTPLFRKHRALSANPSLALNKVMVESGIQLVSCVNAHVLKCMLRFPQNILPCLRVPDLLLTRLDMQWQLRLL